MNRYPMKPYMDEMATHGRYGDSMLVHMNPAEVQGIASLVPGGQLTVNPVTGQPEAFLPILASLLGSWGGSAALTGLGATATSAGLSSTLAGAIGSGIATTAVTGDIKRGLVSGLIGAGTGAAFDAAGEAAAGAAGAAEKAITDTATQELGKEVVAGAGTEIVKKPFEKAVENQLINAGVVQDAAGNAISGVGGVGSQVPASFMDKFGAGTEAFTETMAQGKHLIPTVLGAGQLEQMDMEDQWKAAQMQTEIARQAELDEARGNLQRGYAAAQPDAMRGPSPYRSYLSSYTPDYEYANAGGVVSLMGGGPVKKYQAGGEFDPEVYAQNLPANVRDIYLKSSADGYDSLTEEEAATLSNYFSAAGAGALGGKGGGINVPQTGTQGGTDTTPQNPVTPALPTSGYMRDPYTGAIVYLGGTRPGAGTPMEPRQQNLGGYMGGKGGMNMMTGGAGNPAYGGIDPVTIQANLRGQYSTTPPSGYALGFEPEFNYFQNDPFNVQVPWRGYYPKAFGPMQSGPYFHSSINMPGYLNQIGDYYKELAGYPVPEGTVPQVQPPVVDDTLPPPTPPPPVQPPVTPPVVDTTPQGGIGDIVVGNYQGGAKPSKPKSYEDMVSWNPETKQFEARLFDQDMGDTFFSEAVQGPGIGGSGGDAVDAADLREAARQKVINQVRAHSESDLMRKHAADSPWWDYYSETFGYANPYTKELGAQTEEQSAKAEAFAAAAKAKEEDLAAYEAERLAGRRPNEADAKPLRSSRQIPAHVAAAAARQSQQTGVPVSGGMSVTDSSGKTTYFQEGGDVTLETSLGDVLTPAGGIAGVETEFVKPQTPAPQIAEQDVMMVAQAVLGRIDQPDAVINLFIQKYGVENFLALRQQILASVAGTQPQAEGMVQGQGGGMDDQVMGMIGDQQPVAVSPGEYIVPADVVSGLGDGSSDAGAEELDQMMDNVRKARQGGSTTQPPAINAQRMMP